MTWEILTPREREVARLICAGLPDKQIARELNMAVGTVKVHLHNIYQKLSVQNRTMLATMMVASQHRNFVGVWLGSTLGLLASNALAIITGKLMGGRLPEKYLRYGTSVIFIASGLAALFEAYRHR